MDGVVFTSEYLDGLAEEVNQMLQESGQLRLVELAASFNITTQFLIETLTPRLGTIVSPPPNPLFPERMWLLRESEVSRPRRQL